MNLALRPIVTFAACWAAGTSAAPLTVAELAPGDLLVTEYLANPVGVADGDAEYFEILNRRPRDVDLAGLVVRDDGSNRFVVTSLTVPAGGFAVLAAADGLGLPPDFVFGTQMSLTNGADEIVLERPDGTELHRVEWTDGDAFGAGVAHELAFAGAGAATIAIGPTGGADFVAATGSLALANFGSPGAAGGTVGAGVIPVPAAAWLFGSGLAALATRRRRAGRGRGAILEVRRSPQECRHEPAPAPAPPRPR